MQELDELLDDLLVSHFMDKGPATLTDLLSEFTGRWNEERIEDSLERLERTGIVEHYDFNQLYFIPNK